MVKLDKDRKQGLALFLVAVVLPVSIGGYGWITMQLDHKLPGIVDYKAGHPQKAVQELQDYLKDHPCTVQETYGNSKPPLAQEYLGLAYLGTHQDQKAVDTLENPCVRSSSSRYDLGVALMRQDKLQEARAAFAKCIDLESGKFENHTLINNATSKIAEIDRLR